MDIIEYLRHLNANKNDDLLDPPEMPLVQMRSTQYLNQRQRHFSTQTNVQRQN